MSLALHLSCCGRRSNDLFVSERIEAQLKSIGEKAEKKKTEVCTHRYSCSNRLLTFLSQIIKLQTEIQKSQPPATAV